jgi:haloalkane dehalogenase
MYRKIMPKLAERFRVIAPDYVGFGLSEKPDITQDTLAWHSASIEALMEALALKNITVAATEWGGPIGLSYATLHPENVQRMLLMNTWASSPENHFQWDLSPAVRAARGGVAGLFSNVPLRMIREGTVRPLSSGALAGYKFGSQSSQSATKKLARSIPLTAADPEFQSFQDLHEKLNRVTCRVELLWGTRDPLFGAKVWPYLLRDVFTNAGEPELLENAGRLVAEDAPDRVIDKLLEVFKPKPVVNKPALNILQ